MERIAVLADIHGNADALRAVLSAIDPMGVERIFNLGDHFSGPLAAAETAEILLSRPDILSIRGNHDRYLLTQDPAAMGPSDACAFAELTPAHRAWLAALPKTALQGEIALCHATPHDDETYWLHSLTASAQMTLRPQAELADLAGDSPARLHLCAHTHLPASAQLPDGRRIVNPGSVGCPAYTDDHPLPHVVQSGFPEASFATLTRSGTDWVPTFHRIPYDTRRMAALAAARGRPDWAAAVATGAIPPSSR